MSHPYRDPASQPVSIPKTKPTWWQRLLCRLGLHHYEPHPERMTSEQIGQEMARAKNGWEVMAWVLASKSLTELEQCTRCKKSR